MICPIPHSPIVKGFCTIVEGSLGNTLMRSLPRLPLLLEDPLRLFFRVVLLWIQEMIFYLFIMEQAPQRLCLDSLPEQQFPLLLRQVLVRLHLFLHLISQL